jgi:hypothetical protein
MNRLTPLRTIFTSLGILLQTLEDLNHSATFSAQPNQDISAIFSNIRNSASSHLQNSMFVSDKAKDLRQQISDTLNLKNQAVMQEQSDSLISIANSSARESMAIKLISILSLIYLPSTFVAVSDHAISLVRRADGFLCRL